MGGAFRLLAEGAFDLSGDQDTGWVIAGILVFFFVRLAIGWDWCLRGRCFGMSRRPLRRVIPRSE